MGAPRRDIINYDVTTTYHIICTCVQQDALLGSRSRKQMAQASAFDVLRLRAQIRHHE